MPITVKSLDPDIKAPWTLEALVAGRDTGMEAVAAAIRRSRAQPKESTLPHHVLIQ